MSCYFVAQIKINDEEEYRKYLNDCDEVFSRYKGKYLALDDHPVVLEGTRQYGRMVIIEFPDNSAFEEWYKSPEYQAILKYRLKAAECDTVLIQGNN